MSTWVLLRGLTRESRHWGDFPALLQAVLPGAVVLALDLPGNGGLHALPSPITVEAMADDCRARLQALGLPPPYHLLAMSLGAMVAVAWAHRWPRELAGAVLVNTSLRPISPFYRRLRPRNYARLLRLALGRPDAPVRERTILRLTSRLVDAPGPVLDRWVALRRECPVSLANALRQLLAAARFRAPLTRPALPLLLLASAHDGLVDPRCSRALALAWQAPLIEHPSAGHDLALDDGRWVAQQLSAWVERDLSPGPSAATD